MRFDWMFRSLFILYCVEAGVLLLLAPWSALWDHSLGSLPWIWLRTAALSPVLRGAASGFGVVHLLWGLHDVQAWLAERRLGSR